MSEDFEYSTTTTETADIKLELMKLATNIFIVSIERRDTYGPIGKIYNDLLKAYNDSVIINKEGGNE